MTQGLYLFCLARLNRLPPQALEGFGLDGQSPLQVVGLQELAAVCSPVHLADYCGPEAAERLQNLAWIGPRVVRHQQVVAKVMQHSPVLPARFGTIFSAAANLEGLLRQRHDTIASWLDYFSNKEEWAVKGLLDRSAVQARLFALNLARKGVELASLSPGKRYFQEKLLRGVCDQEMLRWLDEIRRKLWHDLQRSATEVRERRLLSREVNGGHQEMVINWAFLLSAESSPAFSALIQEANARFADRGLSLERTGPWPPYSFCPDLESESAP